MTSLNQFQQSTVDWRASIKLNRRRSRLVIGTFVLLYVALGLLIDMWLYSSSYPQAPLGNIFHAIVTFHLFPIATAITTGIALLSLWVTFKFHDRLMLLGTNAKLVDERSKDPKATQLYHVVEEMKVAAGLAYMPKVFIIEADYMNAFASGYSEKSAMVAITRGLLEKLDREELTAVMAHELSHIRHMDIKLTLVASVLANLLVMVIDILFFSVLFGGRRGSREGGGSNMLFFAIILLRYLLPLLTVLLMLYLSRRREYMADAGCVELMRNNEPLARALLKIQGDHESNKTTYAKQYQKTAHENIRRQAYIFDPVSAGIEPKQSSLSDAFSTHPGIVNRLKALGFKSKQ